MNKLEIVNELRKCAEPTQAGWDVWYHGAYLGTIVKVKAGQYGILRNDDVAPLGFRTNFMAAISSYVEAANKIRIADYVELQMSQPVIRQIGEAPKKNIWQKIKGFFK